MGGRSGCREAVRSRKATKAESSGLLADALLAKIAGKTASEVIDTIEYDRDRKYHKFGGYDEDNDGFHYDTSDAEHQKVIDWFAQHSNNQELFDNFTSEETAMWKYAWIPGDFMDGSLYPESDSYDEQSKKRITDMLDRTTLDEGIVVRRRATSELLFGAGDTHNPTQSELDNLRGQVVISEAPMSTGAASAGLTIGDWRGNKTVEYVIHIPGGTKGAGMYIGDDRINPHFGPGQREFVVNADVVLVQGASRYNKRRKCWEVNMYYVGRTKHDYE